MEKIYLRPRFRKLSENEYLNFWTSLRDARKINKHGEFVILRDQCNYQHTQNFLIGNGIAGFSIMDYEMISVHKNNQKAQLSGVKHILPKMVRCAFKYGARYCDCYGEFLADYYSRSGFIAVAKIPFDNLPDNPKNWNYLEHGKPMAYILVRGVKNVAELDRLKQNGQMHGLDEVNDFIPQLSTLELCEQYREEVYEKIKRFGYKGRLAAIKQLRPQK